MFQTEPILILQALGGDLLTGLMVAVSRLGDLPFYVAVLSLVLFGWSFRRGFLLLQMVLWTAVVTDVLKGLFDMPRPTWVDSRVLPLGRGGPSGTPFVAGGGDSFWALPDADALAWFRSQPERSWGFPSGHVSGAVTLWGGLTLVFGGRALRFAWPLMVGLMALSRMFLGRHFLADVLGGAVVGSLLVAVIYAGVVRPGRFLDDPSPTLQWSARWGLPLLILLGLPLGLMVLAPQVEPQNVGRVLGFNLAFVWVAHSGIPDDEASWPRRLARAALAPLIFVVAGVVLPKLASGLGLDPVADATNVSLAAVQGFLVLWGTVALARRSGLYRS